MAGIAVVAPYEGLASIASDIAGSGTPLTIVKGLMDEGVRAARQAKALGAKVLVSRGGTAICIKEAEDVGLPLVTVPITGYEIARAVMKALEIDRRVAVMFFRNILSPDTKVLSEVFGAEIIDVPIDNEDEARDRLRELRRMGIRVVVGGVIGVQNAPRFNLTGILIESGRNSLEWAIQQANEVILSQEGREDRSSILHQVINSVSDGIIAVDKVGRVLEFNKAAQQMTGLPAAGVLGRHIASLFPNIEVLNVVRTGEAETGEVQKVGGVQVTINKYPITCHGRCLGAVATLQKVTSLQNLERNVRQKLMAHGHVARFTFEDIVGNSKGINTALDTARRFAESSYTVLILGETGTGKELFAQSIHNGSPRRHGPFVAVNCAAFPDTLLESELFGYVDGAFTGARKAGKVGLFEQAHGGTVFLDEIAGMPLPLQERFLRVLEEREVMRIGDDKVIPVDVRVIAASNRDLKALVASGQFLSDLYFRLDVLRLFIPPLRTRKDDIPLLADFFLDVYTRATGKHRKTLSPDAVNLLCRYDWPGNVRELKNIIQRVITLHDKHLVTSADLQGILDFPPDFLSCSEHGGACPGNLREVVNDLEVETVLAALEECHGNKSLAAKRLGISRVTLWRKLKNRSDRSVSST
ncbi:MAG: sigma 54-interacting transcriptional regulator [Firmicutes bacterium]|jgi:PAS domain S-box-containing protein|nr:sigma 54-interacting transcriptional regulator [Bacillota bacterium]